MDDLITNARDESDPKDWHGMVVCRPARSSTELELWERRGQIAGLAHKLPIPCLDHGEIEPLSKIELERLAALGVTPTEWAMLVKGD
jgi:hypothetical protein